MGLLGRLLGSSDRDAGPTVYETKEPRRVLRYYFADTDPQDRDSPLDFQLIFGPHPEEDGWAFLRTNDAHYFDEGDDWYVLIYKNGGIISGDGGADYQVRLGRIFPGEYVTEEHRREFDVMELPEKFVGVTIPQRSEWSDAELNELLLSAKMDIEG